MVESRCAITRQVRFSMSRSSARCTSRSLSVSSALVASSNNRIGASLSKARAIADLGIVAARQVADEIVGARRFRRRLELLPGNVAQPVRDVAAHGVVEQERLL